MFFESGVDVDCFFGWMNFVCFFKFFGYRIKKYCEMVEIFQK